MSNQPKVSVVVPIYNVERYLRQCLDSIVGQTLKDIEIILVDDGSKDGCPAIVDEYAAKDARIVAIHKPNGGLGTAYNTGVARATGEYIGFVESDDWIEPDMYELLYHAAKEHDSDLSKASFYLYNSFEKDEQKQNQVFQLKNAKKILLDITQEYPKGVFTIEDFPQLAYMHSSLWSYLYKADFVRQIPFMESCGASYQDFPFVFEVLCRAKSIVIVPKPLVHWRLEESQSNSTQVCDQRLLVITDRNKEGKEIIRKYGKYDALKESFYFHCCHGNLFFYRRINPKYRREYMKRLAEVFQDIAADKTFHWKYFDEEQRRWAESILKRNYLGTLFFRWKDWRRFFVSIHINLKKGFLIQLLGLQFSTAKYALENRPALLTIRTAK